MPDRDQAPKLRVCALYPDLMNIYADRGNLVMLERRCHWRGLGFTLTGAGIGDPLDSDGADLYYMGGGHDRDQLLCARDLSERKREALQTRRPGRGGARGVRRLPAARARIPARLADACPAPG